MAWSPSGRRDSVTVPAETCSNLSDTIRPRPHIASSLPFGRLGQSLCDLVLVRSRPDEIRRVIGSRVGRSTGTADFEDGDHDRRAARARQLLPDRQVPRSAFLESASHAVGQRLQQIGGKRTGACADIKLRGHPRCQVLGHIVRDVVAIEANARDI